MLGRLSTAAITLGLLGMFLGPTVKADDFDHKSVITFSQPVEIPGRTLPAGTYVFKLMDSASNRHIVQILNQREDKVFATLLTIPEERQEPPSKTVITFEERTANSPEAVKLWFYPGDTIGEEFVYPRTKAIQLAKANMQPVKAMPDETAANITRSEVPSPKPAEQPHVVEMKQAPVQVAQPAQADQTTIEVVELAMQRPIPGPAELPQTASGVPATGLLGLALLVGGAALRVRRSTHS